MIRPKNYNVCLAQHVPELVCDYIAMWYESRAGLKVKDYFYKQLSMRIMFPKVFVTFLATVFMALGTMRKYV